MTAKTEKDALDLLKVPEQEPTPTVKTKARKPLKPLPLGRPPEITPEVITQICEKIKASGAYPQIVAQSMGMPQTTYEKRMRDDFEFRRAIESAGAACEVRLAERVSEGGWNAAAWILERTKAQRYAPKAYIAIDARTIEGMSDRDLEQGVRGIVMRRGLGNAVNSEMDGDTPIEVVSAPDGGSESLD
ncbi:MAG TPA: hypothetical protein ENI27_00940 [bacterium]|nr:hypothetical protein [bacterium]